MVLEYFRVDHRDPSLLHAQLSTGGEATILDQTFEEDKLGGRGEVGVGSAHLCLGFCFMLLSVA